MVAMAQIGAAQFVYTHSKRVMQSAFSSVGCAEPFSMVLLRRV